MNNDSMPPGASHDDAPVATTSSSPRDLFEFAKLSGQKASEKLAQSTQRIINSPGRRERVENLVFLYADIIAMISDATVRDFIHEANGRVGAFTPSGDNAFVFATLDTLLEVEPEIADAEPELLAAIRKVTVDQVIVLTGQPVTALTLLDSNTTGRYGAIRITKLRSRYLIHGTGRQLDA